MSQSFWCDDHQERVLGEFDVVIVGAGISGLSTAYWLNQHDSQLKVAIVDKGAIGSGATGRNAGFLTCGSVEHFNRMVSKHGEDQALAIWHFAEENQKLLSTEIIKDQSSTVEFERKGAFSLAASPSELKELSQVSDLMGQHGISVESLDQKGVESRLGAKGFVGGIKYKDDASVHPIKLLRLIQAKVQADIFEYHPVHKISKGSSGERWLQTDRGKIKAMAVVLCCNGYSAALDPYFEDKIYPTRGQIMMLEPVAHFMEGPCYANFYLDYFRQLPSGALLIGGFRQLEADTEKGFSDHTTEKIQKALHDFVLKHLPQFKGAAVTHRWAGVMGFSVDGEPMIGSLPTDDQIFFCGGFTGHGIGLAFNTGRHLSGLIFGKSVPDWLSSRRF
ncbi:MAG: FAD-binding oxidoreductase [Pseudomonadota bacterium]